MKQLLLVLTLVFSSVAGFADAKLDRIFSDAKKNAVSKKKYRAIRQLKYLVGQNYKLDQVHMTLARVYFEQKSLGKALEHYSEVPKSSDLWLLALEEMAWAHIRNSDYSRAMEHSLTLLSPNFDQVIGSEPYYMTAVNQYLVCDYEGVFKTIKQFKTRYKTKVANLEQLESSRTNSSLEELLKLAKKEQVSFANAGRLAVGLPLQFFRDAKLQTLFSGARRHAANTGKSQRIESAIKNRMRKLAKAELKKISKDIDKLHIVEAEIIQRVFEKNNKPVAPDVKLAKVDGKKYLSFPVRDKEVWIDELDSFEAQSSLCPNSKELRGVQ